MLFPRVNQTLCGVLLGYVSLVLSGCGTSPMFSDHPAVAQEAASMRAPLVTATPTPTSTGGPTTGLSTPTAPLTPEQSRTVPETTPAAPNATCRPGVLLVFNRPSSPSRQIPLYFSASPETISVGQSATLTWSSQNATSVTIDNGIGTVSASGSVTVSPSQTTTYTVTATGPTGSVLQKVTVGVTSTTLTLSASASPQRVTRGLPSTLTWTTTNATSVNVDNGIGPVPLSGSLNVAPQTDTTYTFTATCNGGSTSTAVTVTVQDPRTGLPSLNHIIFMLQENRSFDHYFGKLNDYRVAQGLPAEVDGLPANAVNYDNTGNAVPAYKLQTECIEELTAAWNESHWDFNLHNPTSTIPLMDGFVSTAQGYAQFQNEIDVAGKRAMGYYDATDLNYYYYMATQFATSDRFFSPASSQSVPNRLYAFAATSAGYTKPPTQTVSTKTIFQALDEKGITWKIYYSDKLPDGQPATTLLTFYDYYLQHQTQVVPVSPNYFNDVASGSLPQFVFIEHGSQSGRDEHPGGSNIQVGAQYVSSIINALMNSPSWHDSAFILGYDEGGGLYDHVPVLTNVPSPDGIAPIDLGTNDIPGDFTRTGFRVPMMVVSPYAVKHLVSHTPMDYTAVLKLVETRFSVPALTARDAAMPDMTEFFDFVNPSWTSPPVPPTQSQSNVCYLDHLP